jgi:threonine aldolase
MDFSSDNSFGVHPAIMDAVLAANGGTAVSYGGDDITARVKARFRDLFETDLEVLLVPTGTAANALAVSAFTPTVGAVFAHAEAHIAVEECGSAEFFSGGARLVPVTGFGARMTPATLAAALEACPEGNSRVHVPSVLTLTQATECGTLYRPDDIAALAEIARSRSMAVHIDGARFANAVAALGCPPADIAWRAGVDVMTFGATKNGAMSVEALVLFDTSKAAELDRLRLRAGHLLSKMRFMAAQMDACLADGLWLKLAGDANAAAARLSAGLAALDGVRLAWPTEANEVFAVMPSGLSAHLDRAGARFHGWTTVGLAGTDAMPGKGEELRRLICSFDTGTGAVDRFLAVARGYNG